MFFDKIYTKKRNFVEIFDFRTISEGIKGILHRTRLHIIFMQKRAWKRENKLKNSQKCHFL